AISTNNYTKVRLNKDMLLEDILNDEAMKEYANSETAGVLVNIPSSEMIIEVKE
ncbi:MAG: hypothetical protein HUJ56_06870, partial [Erysipelotrichaceae bacterium]|nr:hypothetical protein [Erysipelotrichaceae bacterium]